MGRGHMQHPHREHPGRNEDQQHRNDAKCAWIMLTKWEVPRHL
jgi:hypothetical protein